jgi:hypothetical protein
MTLFTSTKRTQSPCSRYWRWTLSLLLTTFLASHLLAAEKAEEKASASEQFDASLIENETVTITLKSGVEYEDVEASRVTTHTKTGEPQRLIGTLKSGTRRTFNFGAIDQVTKEGEVVFKNTKSDSTKENPKSKKELDEEAAAKQHELWLARLQARGVKPWGDLSDEEHAEAIKIHKERYEKAAKLMPTLQMYETEHFLFCSNLHPEQVRVFVASLDRMYEWMQQTYGADPDKPVWRGKASVFAFAQKQEFVAFEKEFLDNPDTGFAQGLCHYDHNRNVCITCYTGDNPEYFAVLLVHETSHGFLYCYQTNIQVPSWVNEGMAEVIASKMVPTSGAVQRKEKRFFESMQSIPQPRLGESFFVVDQNIPADRYGGASSMTRFLIQTDQEKYVKFIKLMKEGMEWEEALLASYNANRDQLVSAYGRWIGLPHLLP